MPGAAPLIRLQNLHRSFTGRGVPIVALEDVSLEVEAGAIFGIVGRSGAGKSTLIRCVNLLERPDAGRVLVDGQDLLALGRHDLNLARRRIGMVFQHFNLLARRTVAGNVALALEIAGVPRADHAGRVSELLALVGLEARARSYPAQLSGGQKQRVGIARALAGRPRVLLCDEATSALDPQTTADILALIRDLRERLSLTVLLITHEMAVVKQICDRVAVMQAGRVVEQGRVFDLFVRPRQDVTRAFVAEVVGAGVPAATLARLPPPGLGEQRRLLRILFSGQAATRSVISEASRKFALDLNILSGRIDEIGGEPFGLMAVAAFGQAAQIAAGIAWMRQLGLAVDEIAEPLSARAAA